VQKPLSRKAGKAVIADHPGPRELVLRNLKKRAIFFALEWTIRTEGQKYDGNQKDTDRGYE
jgi:hypothetical protein